MARLATRRMVRSGVAWGAVFGGYVALQAVGFAAAYQTAAERARFAATFSSGGLSALTGPAHEIGTVPGFTAWKCLGVLTVIGAVWGLLASTRLTRGEEDAGRWELLLSGNTTARRATAQACAGMAAGTAVMVVVMAAVVAAIGSESRIGISPSAACFFAVAATCGAAIFLAVGTLAAQLFATRRQAAGWAGAFLAACLAIRMVADSSHRVAWLRNVSPLGWVEALRPLTGSRPVFLVPIVAFAAVLVVTAVQQAGRRDLGTAVVPDRTVGRSRTRMLSSPAGLAVREVRGISVAWLVAVAALSAVLAAIAKKDVASLAASHTLGSVVLRLGGSRDVLKAYLAVSFVVVALLVLLIAAGQVAAIRHEEGSGRVEALLVRPVSRLRWLTGRVSVATGVVVTVGMLGAVFAWLGLVRQSTGVSVTNLLGAGVGAAVAGWVVLGLGVFTVGVAPRLATPVGYGVASWSFLAELLTGVHGVSHWLVDTSLLHQTLASPARAPDWTVLGVLVAVGAAGCAAGLYAFTRRDLAAE